MRLAGNRYVYWTSIVVIIAAVWWWILPPQLLGRTTFFTTRGISMEPLLHQGDLAVLHKSRSYKEGDVIAFRARTLGVTSLHRIVKVEGDVITTKGDNNSDADIDHPKRSDIIGRMDHVYVGKGAYLPYFYSVPARILFAVLIGVFVYFGFRPPGWLGRGRRRDESEGDTFPRQRRTRFGAAASTVIQTDLTKKVPALLRAADAVRIPAMILLSLVLLVSTLATFVGFTHETRTSKSGETIYNFNGRFGYSAKAKAGGEVVYADGQVSTGDSIYLNLVDNLFVTFNFDLSSPANFKGHGTISTSLIISGKTGWTRTAPLGETVSFNGSDGRVSGVINLADAQALSQRVQLLTKVPDGGVTITIRPTVELDGTLAGQHFEETFTSQLPLTGDNKILKVGQNTTPPTTQKATEVGPKDVQPITTGLNTSKAGRLTIPAGAPARIAAFGTGVGIATLRTLGVLGILVSVGGLLVLEWRRREDTHAPQESEIPRDFASLIVPVTGFASVAEESNVVGVATLAHLARIAESGNVLILHETHASGETFAVNLHATTYRYHRPRTSAESRFGTDTIRTTTLTPGVDE